MRKWISKLEFLSSKAVCAMAVVILGVFTYWAGVSTHMTYVELENLKVRVFPDSFWKNAVWLAVVLLLLMCLRKLVFTLDEEANKKRVRIFAAGAAILAGVVSILWIYTLGYEPVHDQLQVVQDAMCFLNGDYSDLKGYLEIYPHQIGLVFLYEVLFSICPVYDIIYYVHVVWVMLIVYFIYKVTEELYADSRVSFYSVIGAVFFIPMYFYVNYAYGDLCMAVGGVVGSWCLIRFCRTDKLKYAVLLLLTMTLSCLARRNVLILLLAMLLVLLITACVQRNIKQLFMAALVLIIPLGSCEAIGSYYEYKAQVEMVSGAPAVLHIAMGMQDVYEGPGYYNAYNLMTYVNNGKDAEKASKIAKEYIKNRLLEMREDLTYTKDFYVLKLQQQWNEPSFSGELSTKTFSKDTPFVQSVYYGAIQQFLRVFRNYYLFILYAGAFIAAVWGLFSRKPDKIWKDIIWIVLVGGVLFSILWENKSRYTMTYVLMLVPYSAYGLYQLQYMSVCAVSRFRRESRGKCRNQK